MNICGTHTEKEYQADIIALQNEIEQLRIENKILKAEKQQLLDKLGISESRRFGEE